MSASIDLTTVWAFIIAFAVFVYVVMDGFDLGLGILFPLFPAKEDRDTITNSVVAGWVSVLVRAGSDGDRASMFLVDLSSPGVRIGEPDLKMGHRGQITADIIFTDVFVPRENLLGNWGSGLGVALSALVGVTTPVGCLPAA